MKIKLEKVFLVDVTDLLYAAEEIGYSWNQAHDILYTRESDDLYNYINRSFPLHDLLLGEYEISEEALKILKHFASKINHNKNNDYWLVKK